VRSAISALLLAGLLAPFGGTAHRKAEEGNRLYADGAFDDALRAYTEAQVAAPDAPELHYDIGNVLYRKEDFKGAAEAFTRALLSAPETLVPDAAYNLGNALYKEEQYEEAVKAYRRVLEKRPDDADAKRNLELALRAMKRDRPQPQEDPQQEQEPGDRSDPQKRQEGSESRGSDDDRRKPERQPERDDESAGSGRMSEQEAARLLESLGEQERQNLKKQAARKVSVEGRSPEKDW
jgi:Ca-activated chloride channel family protein